MTTKNLGVLFIRLYALVEFISQMLRTLAIILNSGLVRRWDLYPLQFLYLLILVLLWFFAKWISEKITWNVNTSDKFIQFSLQDIQTLGISLIGLYLFVHGIPYFVEQFTIYWNVKMDPLKNFSWNYTRLIRPFGETVVGFVLLLGSKGITGFISRTREAGIPGPD